MKKFKNKTIKRIIATVSAIAMTAVSVPTFGIGMTVEAATSGANFDEKNIAMSFAVMTDLHLHQGSNSSAEAVQRQVQRYANTVATLNHMAKANSGEGLDLLMLTGDYCDVGSKVQATAFAAATSQILAELDEVNGKETGFIMAYGNHETEAQGRDNGAVVNPHMTYEEWEDVLNQYGLEATAKDENDEYVPWGCNHETVVKGGKTYHFFSLEIYSYVSPTNMILNEALEWLDAELAEVTANDPDAYVYFACHGPAQESGVYGADMNFDVNAWWGAAKSGVDGWTYASDAQYSPQKATSGDLDEVLRKYPQVVHFSGHYHYSNILESSIMQKNYTAVALSALSDSSLGSAGNNGYYDGLTNMTENNLYNGYSLLVEVDEDGNQRITRVKMDTTYSSVLDATVTYMEDDASTTPLYKADGTTVIEHRDERKNATNVEFSDTAVATPNTLEPWVMNAPTSDNSHLETYSQESRKGTPVFPEGATLEIANIVKGSDDSVTFDVTFDTVGAKTTDTNYVIRYELELYNQDGELLKAGKSYTANASAGKAQTETIWFLGNWASSKNGVVEGSGTTHLDATKLSYNIALTSAQLAGATGIYAKLYAVDEFGGKSEALTYGGKSQMVNVAHTVKNGGFESGNLVNWFDETMATPVKEPKKINVSFSFGSASSSISELVFTFTSEDDLSTMKKQSVSLLKNSEAHAGWDLSYVSGYLWFAKGYGPTENDVIQIPKGLEIICNGERYEIAEDCAVKFNGSTWEACDATPTEEEVGPITVVTDEKRNGDYSLKIEREDATTKVVRTDINSISSETEYKFTYYIKTDVMAAVEATIYEYSFNNKIVGKHQVEVYGAANDWKKGELVFTTSAGADKLGLILTAKGSAGVIYVDDVAITAQGTEKIQYSYDDSNGDGEFNIKDIVRMKSALTNGRDKLATPKYADRNGDGEFSENDLNALRTKALGIADDFTNVLVTDGDIEAFGAKLQSDSKTPYMATGKAYTDDTFTFTSEYVADGKMAIGVRVPQPTNTKGDATGKGVIIGLYAQAGFVEFYGGSWGNNIGATFLNLTPGETYLFSVKMIGKEDGTAELYLEARQDSTIVSSFTYTFDAKTVASYIPAEGQFAVWAQQPCQEMLYQVVATGEADRIVIEEDGIDGVLEVPIIQDGTYNMGYFALDGKYTSEHFRFTTVFELDEISYDTPLGMSIGLHKQDITSKSEFSTGLTIRMNGGYCAVYVTENGATKGHQSMAYGGGTLKPNVEYTFDIQAEGKLVVITIYRGETLHGVTTIGNLDTHYSNLVAGTTIHNEGAYMLYIKNAAKRVAWDMPEEDKSAVEVDANSAAGTAFVITETPETFAKSGYLTTKNVYTTEVMEFTTILEQVNTIILGTRMAGKAHNPAANNGLYIRFAEDGTGYTVYSQSTTVATGTLTTALVGGTEYTFRLGVNGTELRFDILQDKTTVHYAIIDVSSVTVPQSGYFMVWSMDIAHTISYSMPIAGAPVVTVPSDGEDGTVVLNGSKVLQKDTGFVGNVPYLVMDGDYTTETFSFTTTIVDASSPNLYIGARMEVNDGYWPSGPGIVFNIGGGTLVGRCVNTEANSGVAHASGFSSIYYGTWKSTDYLVSGKEHTFRFTVKDTTMSLQIERDGTVVYSKNFAPNNNDYKAHWEHIPTSGDFMVWTPLEGQKISYEMPVNTRESEVVTKELSGEVTLNSYDFPNAGRTYGYLMVDGDYVTERFKITTTLDKAMPTSMYIGMRMAGSHLDPLAMDGFVFQISDWGIAAYCTGGTCANTNLGSWGISLNKANVEYTFEVWMSGNVIYMDVYRAGVKSSHSWDVATLLNGAHISHIPTTGDFMVWSADDTQTFEYEVTVDTTIVTVDADTATGTALLVSNKPGDLENSAYLVTKDIYTTEVMEFTTVLQEVDTMIFGTRMAGKSHNPANYHGLYVQFAEDGTGYTVYNKGEFVATGTLTTALEAGEEYTFRLMADKTFGLVIKKGDTEIHNASIALTNVENVPAEGYFMVWSIDAQHSVNYSMAMAGGSAVVIPEGSEDGSAIMYGKSALAGSEKLSMEIEGDYTTETASFTRTFSTATDHYIGARMTDVQSNPLSSKGIVVKIASGGAAYIYVNGKQLTSSNWTADTTNNANYALWVFSTSAKTFTHTIEVQNFEARGTSRVVVRTIEHGGRTNYGATPEFDSSLIAESGSFAVWTSDEGEIKYTEPTYSHVVVNAATMENESETVSLQAETVYNSTGTNENWSAFLEMDGAYTTEVFEFSTVIDNPANPQLVIGAHMTRPNSQWSAGTGIRLKLADFGLALYGHNYNNWPAYAKSWKNVFTNTNPYDFVLQVQTDAEGYMTVLLDIKQNGETIWSFNSATAVNGQGVALGKVKADVKGNTMNTSGSFVVWSWNESQTITYKKPYELTIE